MFFSVVRDAVASFGVGVEASSGVRPHPRIEHENAKTIEIDECFKLIELNPLVYPKLPCQTNNLISNCVQFGFVRIRSGWFGFVCGNRLQRP